MTIDPDHPRRNDAPFLLRCPPTPRTDRFWPNWKASHVARRRTRCCYRPESAEKGLCRGAGTTRPR